MTAEHCVVFLFIALAAFLTVRLQKLTLTGGIMAWLVASAVFGGGGYVGLMMLGAFFLLGTGATSWKIKTKENMGAAEKNKGKRNAGQVWANGGVAALAGILVLFFPDQKSLFLLMMAASLSSATADTISSELGTLYGKRFYNILSFKPDVRGENGVVSLEGTLLGVAGSAMIAIIFSVAYGWTIHFLWIIVAGTIGNLSDSVLGATLERKAFLKNDAVNFLNTLVAALAMWITTAW